MAHRKDIVERSKCSTLDESLKNKWRWEWTEEKVDKELIGEFIRKVEAQGIAYCLICRKEINYSKRGKVALVDHIKCRNHKTGIESRKTNTTLPGRQLMNQQPQQQKAHSIIWT
eukprot:TRINITY_DN52985_c0_g2_i1.p3 TRINITY_DN52985_c0_g2~~TRINITY_DN52985_c0_g2_i1.p3  ORF type:complete len:114 (+),score=21.14 TRINITY_DN52985_c0_g2_i1:261-602(+)